MNALKNITMTDDDRWRAFAGRDAAFDGAFVAAERFAGGVAAGESS